MAFDSNLVGEWQHDAKNEQLIFKQDGSSFLGTANIPYTLSNNSSTLVINNITTYQRAGNDTGSIVGSWRNESDGEEVTFRSDGRIISIVDDEDLVGFGYYSVQNSKLTSNDFRSICATNNNEIEFFPYNAASSTTLTYAINGQALTIGSETYTKL